MSPTMRRWLTIVCAAVTTAALGGCVDDRSGDAQSIGAQIRKLPGVETVEVDYRNDFTHGENFELDVRLAPAATSGQAQDIVRTFVTAAEGVEFDPSYVSLRIDNENGNVSVHPLTGRDGSVKTDADVATVALWFDVAKAPVVEYVWFEPGQPESITLRQPVDTRAAADLQRTHPQLATADWVLQNPPAVSHQPANRYVSAGVVPDAATQQAWTEIVGIAHPHVVLGEFRPDRTTKVPTTTFEVRMVIASDQEVEQTATPIAAVLARLGRPVQLRVTAGAQPLEITIGGCFRHETHHTESPLEARLAGLYERC